MFANVAISMAKEITAIAEMSLTGQADTESNLLVQGVAKFSF
jgi:hypothetical protein